MAAISFGAGVVVLDLDGTNVRAELAMMCSL
jgi:hypothetical protein